MSEATLKGVPEVTLKGVSEVTLKGVSEVTLKGVSEATLKGVSEAGRGNFSSDKNPERFLKYFEKSQPPGTAKIFSRTGFPGNHGFPRREAPGGIF